MAHAACRMRISHISDLYPSDAIRKYIRWLIVRRVCVVSRALSWRWEREWCVNNFIIKSLIGRIVWLTLAKWTHPLIASTYPPESVYCVVHLGSKLWHCCWQNKTEFKITDDITIRSILHHTFLAFPNSRAISKISFANALRSIATAAGGGDDGNNNFGSEWQAALCN